MIFHAECRARTNVRDLNLGAEVAHALPKQISSSAWTPAVILWLGTL